MSSSESIAVRELRKFGIAFTVFLSLVSTLILWRRDWSLSTVNHVLFIWAGLFFIVALGYPVGLRPVFVIWMKFARALGWINTKIILILLYYLVFTFFSLVIQLLRIDLLNQKMKQNETDFWIQRGKEEPPAARYEKQF